MADPISATLSVLLALVEATYSLLATLTVSHMRGEVQREKRDVAAYEALLNMSLRQDDINASVREFKRTADRLLEQQQTITNRKRPNAMTRPNDESPWSNFAPNSELISIGGQMRLDAKIEILSNERRRCVVDQSRIAKTTLPRFMPPTALRIATYILFIGSPNSQSPFSVPATVASHLAVFRTVKTLAHQRGIEPMLNRVRFYLITGSPAATRITGEYLLGGSSIPFVNTYLDVDLMYGFKSGVVDDRVLTSLRRRHQWPSSGGSSHRQPDCLHAGRTGGTVRPVRRQRRGQPGRSRQRAGTLKGPGNIACNDLRRSRCSPRDAIGIDLLICFELIGFDLGLQPFLRGGGSRAVDQIGPARKP